MENVIELSKYLHQMRKKIGWILLVAFVTGLVAYPLIRMIPSKYTATSVLMIKAQPDETAPLPQLLRYDSTRSDFYETQYSILQSRVVMAKAIRVLKLDQDAYFNGGFDIDQCTEENAALRMTKTLKKLDKVTTIGGIRNTQLINISVTLPSAENAARVANGIAQAYIDYLLDQTRQATAKALRWNQQQMEQVKQQVVEQKALIDALGSQAHRGTTDSETVEQGILSKRLTTATQLRSTAQSQYEEIQKALAANSLADVNLSGYPQISELRIAQTQARHNLSELIKQHGLKHERVQEAQIQVNVVNDQVTQVLNDLARSAYLQYQDALSEENRYKEMLGTQSQPGKFDNYNVLVANLDLDKLQALYQSFSQRMSEYALSMSLPHTDTFISDPAVPPERPSQPNKLLLWIVAVILVTFGYIVRLLVMTVIQEKKINSISQLTQRLGLTVQGELPHFGESVDHQQLVRRIINDPVNAEMVHGIRTHLLLGASVPQMIAITSVEQGEGRSLVAEILAMSFSADQQTLLIDMDYVNDKNDANSQMPGVADVILGRKTLEEVLVKQSENLTRLHRGLLSGSSLLMLTSQPMNTLLQTLRDRYQRIIIDCPAFHQAQDGMVISRQTDGMLIVVQAGRVQSDDLMKMLTSLDPEGNRIIGVVLNQVNEQDLVSQHSINLRHRQVDKLNTPVSQS